MKVKSYIMSLLMLVALVGLTSASTFEGDKEELVSVMGCEDESEYRQVNGDWQYRNKTCCYRPDGSLIYCTEWGPWQPVISPE